MFLSFGLLTLMYSFFLWELQYSASFLPKGTAFSLSQNLYLYLTILKFTTSHSFDMCRYVLAWNASKKIIYSFFCLSVIHFQLLVRLPKSSLNNLYLISSFVHWCVLYSRQSDNVSRIFFFFSSPNRPLIPSITFNMSSILSTSSSNPFFWPVFRSAKYVSYAPFSYLPQWTCLDRNLLYT